MNDALGLNARILVLGGSGFVGRHAVASLLEQGARVVIGSRQPGRIDNKLPRSAGDCVQREICLEALLEPGDWHDLIDTVDVVLNCVGILRQRGRSTYDKVHHLAPAALAQACADKGRRFVHVSALGLHKAARSRFLTSKLAGEAGIRNSNADWVIVRPSLLDGEGGFGARWLRAIAKLPFFFAPMHANGQIAALHVEDLGEALARLCVADTDALLLSESREFDLGGAQHYVFRDYIRALRRRHTNRAARCIAVPGFAARVFAHACDAVHFSPFSFGHWELLARDNKPENNRLPELLGRAPRTVA